MRRDTIGYSTARMQSGSRVHACVAIDRRTEEPWHRAVVEALRLVGHVDVELVDVDGPVPPLADRRFDVAIDLANVDCGVDLPFGVWRYRFGDGAPFADGAPGTLVRLCRATPNPDLAVVLHEGWYRARTVLGWGTRDVGSRVAPWAARALQQIALGDAAILASPPRTTDGCTLTRPPVHPAPPAGAIGDTLRDWLTRPRWSIGIVPFGFEEILQRGSLPEPAWVVGQPADRFYADPFLVDVKDGRVRVLVEDYRYPTREKLLAELQVSLTGQILDARSQPSLPRVASYPFVLRKDGGLFCLPETFRARAVTAFERDEASGEWTSRGPLMTDFPCVDSTVLEHDGRWWLFCTRQGREHEDQSELHLFHAERWQGPYRAHPLNPVKSDTRSSRPAGACVRIGGALYRPAQNCARRYGAGVTINRIRELSTRAFREEPALWLGPSPSSPWPDGLHTINSLGSVTVVDGLRVERRWRKT